FRATDRGKQPHLGRADRGALTDSDVAGLHILPGTTYVSRRRHRVSHLDVGVCARRVCQWHHRIGQRRQWCTCRHSNRLARLQPAWLAGARRYLADHGQRHCLFRCTAHVDTAERVPVDRSLVEPRQRLLRNDFLGTQQPLCLRNRYTDRPGSYRGIEYTCQLRIDRAEFVMRWFGGDDLRVRIGIAHRFNPIRSASQERNGGPYSGSSRAKSTAARSNPPGVPKSWRIPRCTTTWTGCPRSINNATASVSCSSPPAPGEISSSASNTALSST